MELKEKYEKLASRSLSLADFPQIIDLKNQCIMAFNQEYQYLCDILIIDMYIDNQLFDDALNLAIKTFNLIDRVIFQKIYISFLDHIIFIYFQKKNYKSAFRYASLKRNYLNLDNHDEVNRWYLEMAYIGAELNQKDKASQYLQAILNNYPDEPLKALTLSNLTKLYLDDGLLPDAKRTLAEGIKLVDKLKDNEGKLYCEYLNAKLFVLEKNFKYAKQSFHDLFNKMPVLTDAYLGIFNEYLDLLINLEQWDDFDKMVVKYQKSIENGLDLEVKKVFYKHLLKSKVSRDKNLKDALKPLIAMIDTLDHQIEKNQSAFLEISSEDDKTLEVNQRLRLLIDKIEKTMVLTNMALLSETERDCFMEFSKHVETIVGFNEALFIIFSKANFETLPDFFENFNHVKSYEYKKQRLFEREIPYNNLNGTIVEMVVSANHEVTIDFNNAQLPLKNVITDKLYNSSLTKSLIAIPLHYEQDLFACAIFTANDSTLLDVDAMALLKIACKILEFKLISFFYQDSLRAQKNIMQIAMNSKQEGIFYFDQNKQRMFCTQQLASF
ncbi:MAG: tol-pal system YbgF family protein, partial [Bacilli bacterium]